MSQLPLNLIKKLYYKEEISTIEIAKRFGVTSWVIRRFMVKNNLPRRTFKEANAVSFKRKPISFSIKRNLSCKDKQLKTAGIMLYWAEGNKASKRNFAIDFSNSDPKMITLFLKFLREICGVDEKRLRVLLYCYVNQDVKNIKKYWQKITEIPLTQFTKPYIRKDFRPEKSGKMKHGLAHIRYSDKKLFLKIQDWIKEYLKRNNIEGASTEAVKPGSL